jgi:tetratricopeptide (TPR) repeat protein
VVLFAIDAEKGEGRNLAKRYGAYSYPTFQLVNADGATISRWIGYDRDEVIQNIDAGVADATPIEVRRVRFEREPVAADALALGRYQRALMDYEGAARLLRQAQDLAEDPGTDYRYEIFETHVMGLNSKTIELEAVREAADAVVDYAGHTAQQVVRVAAIMTQLGRARKDDDIMVPYLEAAVEITEGADDAWLQAARLELLVEHALFALDSPERAVELRKQALPEGWQEDAAQLNGFAWWCFENRLNLDEAAALATRAVELSTDRRTKANVLDTLAEISNAQGNPAEAVQYIEAAIDETPNWSHLPKQLARFRKAAGQANHDD